MHKFEIKLLLALRPYRKHKGIGRLCSFLDNRYQSSKQPVPIHLHGRDVMINPGNIYPFLLQDCPTFNDPLVELVHQVYICKSTPITFVDVGAATGDTVLLLKERCPDAVGSFICIEGDEEFASLLNNNVRQFSNVAVTRALLASEARAVPTLVKHHLGTAACVGNGYTDAVTLDSLELVRNHKVDILKVDVDGFDGDVIAGAVSILKNQRPCVIFEWHPRLSAATGNNYMAAFLALKEADYQDFLWFHNTGTFSHFSGLPTQQALEELAKRILTSNTGLDEHFDVVALPTATHIDKAALAALRYATSTNPATRNQ